MSEVIKNKVYLGNTSDLNNLNYLQKQNITSIICVTNNIIVKPLVNLYAKIYMYKIPYNFSVNIKQYFNEISSIIETEMEQNNKILICCSNGLNVSVVITIAHLMRYYDMNLLDALQFVQIKRGKIFPSISNIQQLCEYELELFGKITTSFNDIRNIVYN